MRLLGLPQHDARAVEGMRVTKDLRVARRAAKDNNVVVGLEIGMADRAELRVLA